MSMSVFVFCCYYLLLLFGSTRWRSWLTHYATIRKVANDFAIYVIFPARTMALRWVGWGRVKATGADNLTALIWGVPIRAQDLIL